MKKLESDAPREVFRIKILFVVHFQDFYRIRSRSGYLFITDCFLITLWRRLPQRNPLLKQRLTVHFRSSLDRTKSNDARFTLPKTQIPPIKLPKDASGCSLNRSCRCMFQNWSLITSLSTVSDNFLRWTSIIGWVSSHDAKTFTRMGFSVKNILSGSQGRQLNCDLHICPLKVLKSFCGVK
jgi:hypothetical protein